MKHSDFMEKLLDGVEVEWKPIGEVFDLKNGYTPSKANTDYWTNGVIPWFRMEDIRANGRVLRTAIQSVSASAVKGKLIPANSLMMSTTATLGEHALIEVPFITNQQITSFTISNAYDGKINVKFMFHCFFEYGKWCAENANKNGGMGIIGLSKLKQFMIPIPCPENPVKSLKIQSEIVRILDNFTELTAELTAELTTELTARKKQYHYYRDHLLSFEEGGVDRFPMGQPEIGEFIRGGGLQKKDFTEKGVGCIHYGQIYTHYGSYADRTKTYVSEDFFKKARKAKTGDLVIATTSENDEDVCKAVAWLGRDEIAVSSDACIYRHKLNPKYVSYFFQTEQFQKQKRQHITGTKVRRVNADDLAKILIPTPSLAEQARIVAILDKFEALTHSITEGLPREIAMRQQQYEYYRDLLLRFPKPVAETPLESAEQQHG